MVLDLHREPLVVGVERGALRHSPGLEDPVEFQPQVVVQMRRRMLLDDETETLCFPDCGVAAGLCRLRKIPFGTIFSEQFLHSAPCILQELKVPGSVKVPVVWRFKRWRRVPSGRGR